MAHNPLKPSLQEFLRLARRGNVVPVYQEILADFETPLSAYLKLGVGKYSYLLESVERGEKLGRYSFLGGSPRMILESRGSTMKLTEGARVRSWTTGRDPLTELKKLLSTYKSVPVSGLPRFSGGAVGYAGYEIVHFLESIGPRKKDLLELPDSVWVLSDTVVIFDHLEHLMKVVANAIIPSGSASTFRPRAVAAYKKATRQIETMVRKLHQPLRYASAVSFSATRHTEGRVRQFLWRTTKDGSANVFGGESLRTNGRGRSEFRVHSNMSRNQFLKAVGHAKEAIRGGEIIQTVLSQRFSVPVTCSAFEIYRALRSLNPSPYMFYLNMGSFTLAGSSPEILVRCEDGVVETRPIAGTRRRGKTPAADGLIEEGLKKDPKERAEHLMLADLGRNDIGRVCEYGSVKVKDLMSVERYSHVMHLVSSVTGKLRKGKNAFDLLRCAFPAGTVTGAPKVRAMQIIHKLEPDSRGPYAGAVGYISFDGNLDTCITIRTILVHDKRAYVQAGAGIVADSKPEREYEETRNKAAGMIEAIRLAEQGLVL